MTDRQIEKAIEALLKIVYRDYVLWAGDSDVDLLAWAKMHPHSAGSTARRAILAGRCALREFAEKKEKP